MVKPLAHWKSLVVRWTEDAAKGRSTGPSLEQIDNWSRIIGALPQADADAIDELVLAAFCQGLDDNY